MNKNIVIAVVIGALAVIGGIFVWQSTKDNLPVNPTAYDPSKVITEGSDPSQNQAPEGFADHVSGKIDSPVVVVEYGDMACTGCAGFAPTYDQIRADYADRVAFVWRYWPNPNIQGHQNTRAASVAAEVAGYQGKFWEYTELMLKNQSAWAYLSATARLPEFRTYAEAIGLDVARWEADYQNPKSANQHVEFNFELGKLQDVAGTPSFFINGKLIEADEAGRLPSGDKIRQVIDEALATSE